MPVEPYSLQVQIQDTYGYKDYLSIKSAKSYLDTLKAVNQSLIAFQSNRRLKTNQVEPLKQFIAFISFQVNKKFNKSFAGLICIGMHIHLSYLLSLKKFKFIKLFFAEGFLCHYLFFPSALRCEAVELYNKQFLIFSDFPEAFKSHVRNNAKELNELFSLSSIREVNELLEFCYYVSVNNPQLIDFARHALHKVLAQYALKYKNRNAKKVTLVKEAAAFVKTIIAVPALTLEQDTAKQIKELYVAALLQTRHRRLKNYLKYKLSPKSGSTEYEFYLTNAPSEVIGTLIHAILVLFLHPKYQLTEYDQRQFSLTKQPERSFTKATLCDHLRHLQIEITKAPQQSVCSIKIDSGAQRDRCSSTNNLPIVTAVAISNSSADPKPPVIVQGEKISDDPPPSYESVTREAVATRISQPNNPPPANNDFRQPPSDPPPAYATLTCMLNAPKKMPPHDRQLAGRPEFPKHRDQNQLTIT